MGILASEVSKIILFVGTRSQHNSRSGSYEQGPMRLSTRDQRDPAAEGGGEEANPAIG